MNFSPRITGRSNVPKTGPVIIASNHLSFIDSIVITLVAPRSVSFLAKSSYFTGTGFRGAVSRAFFTAVGAIVGDRGAALDRTAFGPADSGRALREATDAVMSAIHAMSGQPLAGAYNEPPPANVTERVRRLFRRERS